jgi:hypothetical protein
MPNGYVETEDLEDLVEALEEYDEEDDLAERRRKSRRPPPPTSSGNGLYQQRPSGNVTQAQLQTAMARVGAQIKTNSDAIKTLNARVATVSSDQARHAAALRKEAADRKRETAALRNQVQRASQNSLLLFLLTQPKTVGPTTTADKVGGVDVGVGTKLVVQQGDGASSLLPILLLAGGLGGGGGGGGDGQASTNEGIDPLVAVAMMGGL